MRDLFLPWKAVGEFAIIDCRDFRVAQCVEKGINKIVVEVVNASGLKQLVSHPKRGPRKQASCQVLPKSLEHLVCQDLQELKPSGKFFLETSPGEWVHWHAGKIWKTTKARAVAWKMKRESAEIRLTSLREIFPEAKIISADSDLVDESN